MKILYIEHYAGSISMGMEFRPFYFAREWMKKGHEVRIIAADYSHLRMRNPNPSKDFSIEKVDGVTFQWIHTGTYEGNGTKRAMSMFQFCGKLWIHARRIAREFKPDVVIASSTYPLDTWPAQRISRITKAKYIHEVHDLWPLTLTELAGISKRNPFVMFLQKAENSAYCHADSIVTLFPNTWEHLSHHGLRDKSKCHYIPNGIVVDDWQNCDMELPEEMVNAFNDARAKKQFIVCYLGGHALSNSLDVFIDAARSMKGEPVRFILIGKGVEKQELIKRAAGFDNIRFFEALPKTKVAAALSRADALYVGARPCSLYRFGVSLNKLYDYMMAEKPILYGVVAANNEVEEAGCGITIQQESAQSIVEGIHSLIRMPEDERAHMGKYAKVWVLQNRSYSKLASDFEEIMTK